MKLLVFPLFLISILAASAAPYSTGELVSKWDKNNISVCWLDDEPINKADFAFETWKVLSSYEDKSYIKAPDHLKQKIQTLIETEYTPSRTGVHFTGWKSCKDSDSFDVQILIGDKSRNTFGHATLGRLANIMIDYSLMDKENKGYVFINTMKRKIKMGHDDSILLTTLHEFGHLAGLRHEHIQSTTCDYRLREKPREKTSSFSSYDASSIMDYCLLDFLEQKAGLRFYAKRFFDGKPTPFPSLPTIPMNEVTQFSDETIFESTPVSQGLVYYKVNLGLSKGDVHGLKCMYVYAKDEFTKKCHKNFAI